MDLVLYVVELIENKNPSVSGVVSEKYYYLDQPKMPPKKATTEQYNLLIDLVVNCESIRWGKGTPDMKIKAWEEIANSVNVIGGIQKPPEGWKKAFTEMKSHIKSKIRGQNPCSGMVGIPELGSTEKFTVEKDGSLTVEVEEEVPAVTEFAENQDLQPHKEDENAELAEEVPKKTGTKKKPSSVLLYEHIRTTNKGLQDIAKSIQSVADAINNVALAIRENKK